MFKSVIRNAAVIAVLPCLVASGAAMASGTRATIEEVEVGQAIQLAGILLPNKTIIATEIAVVNEPPAPITKIVGPITSVDASDNSFVALGLKIVIDPEAVMEWSRIRGPKKPDGTRETLVPARPLKFSELKPGLLIKVKGLMNDDGTMTANAIKCKEKKQVEVEMEAGVDAVDIEKRLITVQGFKVMVNNRTLIEVD